MFSSKFSFADSSSWLVQEAAEHYQVTLATGVKMLKVGSSFSLTLFLPWFSHFKLFLRLWRINPHHKWRLLIISRAYNSEHVCVKHTQSGKLSFWNQFIVYVWTGENVTSGREHFWKRTKKVAFSNEYGYVWTGPEWSPIRSVIIVINKIRGSPICFIMSMITNRIGQDEVRLPIHHNYNKICDILGFSSN